MGSYTVYWCEGDNSYMCNIRPSTGANEEAQRTENGKNMKSFGAQLKSNQEDFRSMLARDMCKNTLILTRSSDDFYGFSKFLLRLFHSFQFPATIIAGLQLQNARSSMTFTFILYVYISNNNSMPFVCFNCIMERMLVLTVRSCMKNKHEKFNSPHARALRAY
jgi:hypothetical protein